MSELRVTIAICTYNRAGYLQDTLVDFTKQTVQTGSYEILIVNNNSTDDTESVCRDFQKNYPGCIVRVITETKQGLSHARNRAMADSLSDWVLFIDDDVILPADYVEQALTFIEQRKSPCGAGGKITVSFDEGEPDWIPHELMPMFGLHDLGDTKKRYPEYNFPRGGNMLIHKKLYERTGGFDPALGRKGRHLAGSEEKAFFEEARNTGHELWYLPEMKLQHRIGSRRLRNDYLKKQSTGIGYSEYQRLKGNPLKLSAKFAGEIAKFVISIVLSVFYLLRGKVKAASFILIFRVWVLNGFFSR